MGVGLPREGGGSIEVVLVLRALGLGDLLTALPALRALRHHLTSRFFFMLAAPAWLAPLALHSRAVDGVLPAEELAPVGLRGAALAVNLHGRGPQSHRLLLDTGPRSLLAFHHPDVPETAGSPRWRPGEHEVRRWCRLLAESGIPADPTRLELDPAGLPEAPERARGATLIHPGAKDPARRWPAERWAAVARHEAREGRPVLVTAGPGEEALAAAVVDRAGLGDRAVWAGGDVSALAGLIAVAGRVLSGDTGVGHLATALDRPSVALFGPVPPAEWGPPPGSRHRALWAGRCGDPHGRRPDAGLLEIQPEDVVRELAAIP
jgi:ADP-heptose:LPS heptosyltransferase